MKSDDQFRNSMINLMGGPLGLTFEYLDTENEMNTKAGKQFVFSKVFNNRRLTILQCSFAAW